MWVGSKWKLFFGACNEISWGKVQEDEAKAALHRAIDAV
jgi:hypothetical protein